MKAETILKLIERAREPLLKEAHIKAYAQAMVEKDRERVKEVCKKTLLGNLEVIDETPIILD
jgi:hypothetical protein